MPDDRSISTGFVATFIFRDMSDDEFWMDVQVDGAPYGSLGPFESEGERMRAHDDVMRMLRETGATDVPGGMH